LNFAGFCTFADLFGSLREFTLTDLPLRQNKTAPLACDNIIRPSYRQPV
jgi:hypothetical protein